MILTIVPLVFRWQYPVQVGKYPHLCDPIPLTSPKLLCIALATTTMDSRIPKPGVPNYLKQLSDALARLMSSNVPFDENIFTWILYCLAVGDKHLILRTSQKDLASVQKTAKSVRM